MSIFLVEEKGTWSSLRGIRETIEEHGPFSSVYIDRGSHYFFTPEAGEKVDATRPTQVGRALAQLGIEHIASYSPQVRGRMERLWGTLQKRLPPPLRQEGVGARRPNRWPASMYMAQHNESFGMRRQRTATLHG